MTVKIVAQRDVLYTEISIQKGFNVLEEPGLIPPAYNVQL